MSVTIAVKWTQDEFVYLWEHHHLAHGVVPQLELRIALDNEYDVRWEQATLTKKLRPTTWKTESKNAKASPQPSPSLNCSKARKNGDVTLK